MEEAENQPNSEVEIKKINTKTPFDQLGDFLKTNGVAEGDKTNHKRKIVFRTKSRLPLIGKTYYKTVDLNISQETVPSSSENSDRQNLTITIVDTKTAKIAEQRKIQLPDKYKTIITFPKNSSQAMAIMTNPNNTWRWVGLDSKLWQKDPTDPARYITQSLEEANKLVQSFTDTIERGDYTHVKKSVKEPLLGRYDFLNIAGKVATLAVLDSITSHIPRLSNLTPNQTKQFWEHVETLTLGVPPKEWEKYLKTQMGVNTMPAGILVPSLDFKSEIPTVDWDSPRLKAIYRCLLELPENFRAAGKLKVGLVDYSYNLNLFKRIFPASESEEYSPVTAGAYCSCHNAEEPMVIINKDSIKQTLFESAGTKKVIAHELTHVITSPHIEKYIQSIAQKIGLTDQGDLLRIFATEVLVDPRISDLNTAQYRDIKNKSKIGYGAKSFFEFFSVASEYYLDGKDTFIHSYAPFLGKEKAETLYQGMKNEIFLGQEY